MFPEQREGFCIWMKVSVNFQFVDVTHASRSVSCGHEMEGEEEKEGVP